MLNATSFNKHTIGASTNVLNAARSDISAVVDQRRVSARIVEVIADQVTHPSAHMLPSVMAGGFVLWLHLINPKGPVECQHRSVGRDDPAPISSHDKQLDH
jgi:hypothetical protein